jgi:hypothetical protein
MNYLIISRSLFGPSVDNYLARRQNNTECAPTTYLSSAIHPSTKSTLQNSKEGRRLLSRIENQKEVITMSTVETTDATNSAKPSMLSRIDCHDCAEPLEKQSLFTRLMCFPCQFGWSLCHAVMGADCNGIMTVLFCCPVSLQTQEKVIETRRDHKTYPMLYSTSF